MNTIFRKNDGTVKHNEDAAQQLAGELGLSRKTLEILLARGYSDKESIERFLHGHDGQFNDPFLLSGMQELTERLSQAIEGGETVVVYGDYDADGICSTAILTDYLINRGVNVVPYIPSRHNEGYGLSIEALERIIEEFVPDLILTCDCGISACEEVRYVLDLGVDIIITDHHEVPECCPECVIVNPKVKGQAYPFESLCGAGVALKVVQAMGGDKAAAKYYDLCALATVADLVPLVEENRAIVKLGLRKINSAHINKGLKGLLDFIGYKDEVTASDLAFKIAPKINAAGRMGDAYRAFSLLTEENPRIIFDLIKEISLDNDRRKEICESVYSEAVGDIANEDIINNYSIILSHPSWERGLTSIVAAQLAGEYKRPTFLMVEVGDNYKGTARSVEGVNLYELLASASDLLVEFGGHNQAAGFSIAKGNVLPFKERINKYLRDNYSAEYFLPYANYDTEAKESELTSALAKELDCLEPFGLGNQRPVFRVDTDGLNAQCMKNKCQHLIAETGGGLRVTCFGYGKYLHAFNTKADFSLAVAVSVNRYKGKEYLGLTLRDVDFGSFLNEGSKDVLAVSWIMALCDGIVKCGTEDGGYSRVDWSGLGGVIDNTRIYGTMLITYDFGLYTRAVKEGLINDRYLHNYVSSTSPNNYNRIFVGPESPHLLNNYDCVVILGTPPSDGFARLVGRNGRAKVWVAAAEEDNGAKIHERLDLSRECFIKSYTCIMRCGECVDNIYDYYRAAVTDGSINIESFVLCVRVLEELGVVAYDTDGRFLRVCEGVKVELSDSKILKFVKQKCATAK